MQATWLFRSGSSALSSALLMLAVLGGCQSDGGNATYVAQLEGEIRTYTDQIDSLNATVDGLSDRLNGIRAQLDTARTANTTLVASLQKVSGELKEYRRLYTEQRQINDQLRSEVGRLKQERDRSVAEAQSLKAQAAGLDEELSIQRSRVARLEEALAASVKREADASKALTQVFVYEGTRETLEKGGYLLVKQQTVFTDSYRQLAFPGTEAPGVKRVSLNEAISVEGELRFLVDRHGKLKKDQAYKATKQGGGTQITFLEPILQGQRVLAVVKK